jgi:hypothetical protein
MLPLSGCAPEVEKSTCDKICDSYFGIEEEFADDKCDGFDEDDDSVMEKCLDACDDEWDDLGSSDKDRARECVVCVVDEIGGSSEYDDLISWLWDDCEDECEDEDVDDFMLDFMMEWWAEIEYDGVDDDCVADHFTTVFDW